MKKLGIVGGMGPKATAELFSRIVSLTDSDSDQGHLNILIDNDPSIPDRTAFVLNEMVRGTDEYDESIKPFAPYIAKIACNLEQQGCEVLAMPCNSAHTRLDEVQKSLGTSVFVNMLEETALSVKQKNAKRPMLLGTNGTISAGVFKDSLADADLGCIVPNASDQEVVMDVIYGYVKQGKAASWEMLKGVLDDGIKQGCDSFILGCTELSLIGFPENYKGFPVVDALTELAKACVRECGARVKTV